MPIMKMQSSFLLCLTLFIFATAHGIDPQATTLHGPVAGSGTGQNFGKSVAATESYTLVGNPEDSDLNAGGGAVHIFRTRDGKRLRTLRPSDPEDEANFGAAVAISGNYALIGAPLDDGDFGSAYVFDVRNGKELFKIPSTAAAVNSFFGSAVDLEGTLAVIGAPSDNGVALNAGAVTLLRIDPVAKTFATLFTGAVAETVSNDFFATSVSISDETLLVGAPGRAAQTGAVYFLNALTGAQLDKSVASDGLPGDRFGWSVDMHGDRALVGAPQAIIDGQPKGAAYLFFNKNGNQTDKLFADNGISGDRFGEAVALCLRTAFIGAPGVSDGLTDNGTVYVFQNGVFLSQLPSISLGELHEYGASLACAGNTLVIGAPGVPEITGYAAGSAELRPVLALPLSGVGSRTFAKKGDSVPGVAEATYRSFPTLQLRYNDAPVLLANLAGRGAPAGKNVGLFTQWSNAWSLRLRTGDILGPLKINRITNPVDQYSSDFLFFQVRGTGVGINSGNDEALVSDDGTVPTIVLREGDDLISGGFAGQRLSVMGPVLGNNEDSHPMLYSTLKSGIIPVSASGNSCAIIMEPDPFAILGSVIEGTATPLADVNFGEVYTRVGSNTNSMYVVTALTGTGTTSADNAAIWRKPASASPATLIARKGEVAAGGTIRAFLGEAFNYSHGIYRCSLSGVSSSQNEAIFAGDSFDLLCQEGVANPALPTGVVVSQFLRYFAASGDEAFLLVKLRGTGVNASNDLALLYCVSDTDWQILMREGDLAPETGGARVGRILQVDAEAEFGSYAVLVTLTGCSSATNQALYAGTYDVPGTFGVENRNRPRLRLRKGTYQTLFGKTAALRSIKLPVILEATGAGNRGLGSTVSDDLVTAQLTLSDGSVLVTVLE